MIIAWSFLERLRQLEARLAPTVRLGSPICAQAKTIGGLRTEYLHVIVENLVDAAIHTCQVKLTAVTREIEDSPPERFELQPPVTLPTASTHKDSATIHQGVPQAWDLAQTIDLHNWFGIAETVKVPLILEEQWFDPVGVYDFEVAVTADNAPTTKGMVRVSWTGTWDAVTVELVDPVEV